MQREHAQIMKKTNVFFNSISAFAQTSLIIELKLTVYLFSKKLGTAHLTSRGGGVLCFFSKQIFWFPMLLKKILWFWWRKKKYVSEILSYNLMLYSGKKIRALCDKKNKYSNSCCPIKKFWMKHKTIHFLPHFVILIKTNVLTIHSWVHYLWKKFSK